MEILVKNIFTFQRNVASSRNSYVFIFTAPKSMELITAVKLIWIQIENVLKWKLLKFFWISGFGNTFHRNWCVEIITAYLTFSSCMYVHFAQNISALCKAQDTTRRLCWLHEKLYCATGSLAESCSPAAGCISAVSVEGQVTAVNRRPNLL